jgi:hypothetical protein
VPAHPDTPTLLDAVARFLLEEVGPALDDRKALQFRSLIAANIASVAASELRAREASERDELVRLLRVTAVDGTPTAAALTDALASELRGGQLSKEREARVLEALIEHTKAVLALSNPRFDTEVDPP